MRKNDTFLLVSQKFTFMQSTFTKEIWMDDKRLKLLSMTSKTGLRWQEEDARLMVGGVELGVKKMKKKVDVNLGFAEHVQHAHALVLKLQQVLKIK